MTKLEVNKEIREAIKQGRLDRVTALIESDNARLNAMTPFGTWLHVAAAHGKLDIVRYLLDMGIDINRKGGMVGAAAIEQASSEGHLEVVKYLLSRGAELDVSTPEGNPLFGAILGGYTGIAKLLIDAGIDTSVQYKGTSGRMKDAMLFARDYGRREIIELLGGDGDKSSAPSAGAPHADIIAHMARHFGPVQDLGLQEVLPTTGVRVNVIAPRSAADPLILFTTGMSDFRQNVPSGQELYSHTELMIRLPHGWPLDAASLKQKNFYWPIEWLRKIAAYPRLHNTWLRGKYAIFSNGEPPKSLAPNTRLSCLMVLEEAKRNPIQCKDGSQIVIYSIFPLYAEERDLEKAKGFAGLLGRFQELGISLVMDPNRPNAALGE